MANAPVVHIGENSPQKVALELLEKIAAVEQRAFTQPDPHNPFIPGWTSADRKWILDTYAECLQATLDQRSWQ